MRTRDDGSCELVDGGTSWEIPAGVVATATATGVDAPTLVVFRLVTEATLGVGKEEKVLLDAEAGAGAVEPDVHSIQGVPALYSGALYSAGT